MLRLPSTVSRAPETTRESYSSRRLAMPAPPGTRSRNSRDAWPRCGSGARRPGSGERRTRDLGHGSATCGGGEVFRRLRCTALPGRGAGPPGAGISAKVPAGPGPGKLSRYREPLGMATGPAHQSLPGRPRLTGHRPGSRASARIRKHFYRVRSCTLWCAGSFAILGCAYRQSPSHHSYQNAVECAFGRLATRCPTGKRLLARHSAFSLSQIPLPYVSHIETVCHRSIT